MNITQALHRNLQLGADRPMTIFGERTRTVRQFVDRVARLAGALQRLGMGSGDRVAMLGLNSDRYVEHFFGVPWGDGVLNPCNIRWSTAENAYALGDSETSILIVQMVVHHADAGKYDLSSLHVLLYGASPIQEKVVHDTVALLPGVKLFQIYGQTEMAPFVSILGPGHHSDEGAAAGMLRSCGRAAIGVEIRIVDAQGREVPRGTVGEIAARGPNMMQGYWNKPEQTKAALPGDGWLRTGDGAYMDDNGYMFIVDRVKDMIVTGGENVFSAEVENALASHPAVAMCAVIGIPDEQWGEAVHGVVVAKAGAAPTAEGLIANCKTRIAGYKCPKSVELRDALPISGAGKILKTALREPYWRNKTRRVG